MHAVCPGSFDPITNGHLDIILRAARQWDTVTLLVTYNPNKKGLFNIDERMELITQSLQEKEKEYGRELISRITVDSWDQLLVTYLDNHNVQALVKGLRSTMDYEYETPMAQMNHHLAQIETYFLLTKPEYGYISSTLCKEVARYGGDVSALVPTPVAQALSQKFS